MKELTISITYHFEQQYLPTKKHRNPETRIMTCTYDAKVKILDENEFPVALKVTDYGYYGENRNFELGTTDIRTFDGELWKLNKIESGEGCGTPIPVDSLTYSLNPARYERHYHNKSPYKDGESIIVSDNKEEIEEEIRERAKNVVIFNDNLWILSGQPYYYLDNVGFNETIYLTVNWTFDDKIKYQNYLAGQERQLTDKIDSMLAKRRNKDNSYKGVNIKLILPEAYTLKREYESEDLKGYFYDDTEGCFVKEYLGEEPTMSEIFKVTFKYSYVKYIAKVYIKTDYQLYDKRLVWYIVGQLMEDVRDLKFEDIKKIYSIDHGCDILKVLNEGKGITE